MVVSLPSSLTGVVRKKEVSDYFYAKASTGKKHRGGKGRYFDEGAADDASLRDMFMEGQVSYLSWVRVSGQLDFLKNEKGMCLEISLCFRGNFSGVVI